MKTVWIEMPAPDDARPDQIAEALELMFKVPAATVLVNDSQRAALDALRTVTATSSALEDLRIAAAETVHLSFDYGQNFREATEWKSAGERLTRTVLLDSPDPNQPPAAATLEVVFEPGTAIILDAAMSGPVEGPGRRLDPLLIDTEEMLQTRLAAVERAQSRLPASSGISPTSPWYRLDEYNEIALARDVVTANGPARLVATFRPGSRILADFVVDPIDQEA